MVNRALLLGAISGLVLSGTVLAATPSPDGARAYIVSPADGATVTSPVKVQFGLDGMEVVPAGTDKANSGHHHLLIDTAAPAMDKPIPKDDKHVHFGKGQTEAMLDLKPGTHTLQLMLGDKAHVPHSPAVMSDKITITVQ